MATPSLSTAAIILRQNTQQRLAQISKLIHQVVDAEKCVTSGYHVGTHVLRYAMLTTQSMLSLSAKSRAYGNVLKITNVNHNIIVVTPARHVELR